MKSVARGLSFGYTLDQQQNKAVAIYEYHYAISVSTFWYML